MEDALVIDTYTRDVVYHASGDGSYNAELRRYVWWTRCGRNVGAFSAWLKRWQAGAFARPCSRCYEAGLDGPVVRP